MKIRTGSSDDVPAMLALADTAVAWLTAQGRTGQWGSEPWSARPAEGERMHRYARDYLVRIAEDADGQVVGVCVLAEELSDYVVPADIPDLYVRFLLTDRSRSGSGIGAALIRDAREEAVRRGLKLLRVDCFRSEDRALVRQYQALGFTESLAFDIPRPDGSVWPGQILEIRL
ncbi:GNAT family N-acetyltransferase [Kitasatospora kifunensis]|uniref:GNAT superfamily N-acetyltransferase n=1 Tax=Kitasatospora kifunensis TaxID=58351 RepID=A0A7W7R2A2_KITKI|nr:GNAT family N-acetyltransferase [Kitasatospora kifunensis]MBB4924099.1 GNAT superfamily N-acetyltransferase [Kitasatospora kifunensis]